jgi:lysophospholipase L1-like esterase
MNWKWKLLAFMVTIIIVVSGVTVFLPNIVNNPEQQELPIRVACVGDSITNVSGYPDDLWMLLGANYNVSKFGVGSATITLNSERPYIDQIEMQEAKNFQPNIIIIMLGTNDAYPGLQKFNATFVQDYKQLIAQFQAIPTNPKIWIVKPPPIFNNGTGLSTEFLDTNIIPRIDLVAKETNMPIIDVHSALAGHPDFFADGVHPKSEGAKVIAYEIYKALIST